MHLDLKDIGKSRGILNCFFPDAVRLLVPCALGLFAGLSFQHFSPKNFPIRGTLVLERTGPGAVSEGFSSESSELEKIAESVRSPKVLSAAIEHVEDLHPGFLAGDRPLARLRDQLKVWIHPATRQVEIGLDSTYPHQAAAMVNAIIASFSAEDRIAAAGPRIAGSGLALRSVRPASPEVAAKSWPTVFCALAGSDVGLLLGLLFAVIGEASAKRVRGGEPGGTVFGLPVRGSLSRLPNQRSWIGRGLTPHILPSSKAAAEIRAFAEQATANQPGSEFLVTSPNRGEGRSTVALNLSVTLAAAGHDVVLVDADLRSPKLHQLLEIGQRGSGLSDALGNPRAACGYVQPTHIRHLHVLPMGTPKASTESQLSDVLMENVLGSLREKFRYIVVDGGPLLGHATTLRLATRCQKTLLVLEEKRTRLSCVAECRNLLAEQGVRDVAVLVNARHRADHRKRAARPSEAPILLLNPESQLAAFDWFQQKNAA